MSDEKERRRPRRALDSSQHRSKTRSAAGSRASQSRSSVRLSAGKKDRTTAGRRMAAAAAESAPSPAAKKRRPRKRRGNPAVLPLCVLAVLLAGYLFLCAGVDTDTILTGTAVNGVDLSGMTQKQATAALEENFQGKYGAVSLQVVANGETYEVTVGNTLTLDCDALAAEALAPSGDSFLLRGKNKVITWLLGSESVVLPQVGDTEQLHQNLEESGLLAIDTTVQTTYEEKDRTLVVTKGVTGNSVDEESLVQYINKAVQIDDYTTPLECPMATGEVKALDWDAITAEICHGSTNATLKLSEDRREYEIVDGVAKVSFDAEAAKEAVDAAEEGSTVKIDLTYEKPEISTAELKENLFRDKLGSYSTNVGGTANRLSNVRLAAEKCDGIILLPGDSFSYNNTLGERTAANGFKTAGAYLNGETVQEYGGGICQVSSTLYSACLYSNLEIVERHNHTFASSYIGLGMDATVSWGGPDYQFANNQTYPIKISASYYNGVITVTIWGTKTDNTSVEIRSETLETIAYDTVYKEDSSMYEGESKTTQKGVNGYHVQTYRIVYDGDGKEISNEKEAYSVYTPEKQIVYQGTKKKVVIPETTTDDAAAAGGTDANGTAGATNTTGNAAAAAE